MEPYRAIVLGASGAVGSALVAELLASPLCTGVTILVRRTLALADAKLDQRVIAMDAATIERETAAAAAGAHVAFCTLGIGQPSKVSKAELWTVDVELAAAFARGCHAAGVAHISLLSAVLANAKSRSYYLRVKGTAEAEVAAPGFARASWFRPSLLVTKRIRYGLQDRLTQAMFPVIAWVLPRKFHGITVEDLGRAMRINAERPATGPTEAIQYREMRALLAAQPTLASST